MVPTYVFIEEEEKQKLVVEAFLNLA